MKKKVLIAGICSLLALSCGAFAGDSTIPHKHTIPGTLQKAPVADKALLVKLEAVCRKMANVKGNYTLAGILNINDKANPADKAANVKFLFSKKGEEFYYKLGNTVTLNVAGAYVYIDYQSKRIIVSKEKQVNYDFDLKQLGNLAVNIQGEHYKLTSKVTGNDETLSLVNERHISCKQYTITFDKQTLKAKRLFIRLSNFSDPLRTDNEKVIDVSISQWTETADPAKYLTKNEVIKFVNGRWKTTDGFKGYQLTEM